MIVKTKCETAGYGSYAALLYSGYIQGFFGSSGYTGSGRQEVAFVCYMKFIFYAYTKKSSFFTSHESDSEPTTAEGNLDFTLF